MSPTKNPPEHCPKCQSDRFAIQDSRAVFKCGSVMVKTPQGWLPGLETSCVGAPAVPVPEHDSKRVPRETAEQSPVPCLPKSPEYEWSPEYEIEALRSALRQVQGKLEVAEQTLQLRNDDSATMLTMKQAGGIMKELFGGDYRCWNHEIQVKEFGVDINKQYQLGISGLGRHVVMGSGRTWEQAIAKMIEWMMSEEREELRQNSRSTL